VCRGGGFFFNGRVVQEFFSWAEWVSFFSCFGAVFVRVEGHFFMSA
jgi:hypothetical protein